MHSQMRGGSISVAIDQICISINLDNHEFQSGLECRHLTDWYVLRLHANMTMHSEATAVQEAKLSAVCILLLVTLFERIHEYFDRAFFGSSWCLN
jgi:hypothetical protein